MNQDDDEEEGEEDEDRPTKNKQDKDEEQWDEEVENDTVLFHSIRHPVWRVTSLPKFRFRQAPDLNVTSKYFRQVRV